MVQMFNGSVWNYDERRHRAKQMRDENIQKQVEVEKPKRYHGWAVYNQNGHLVDGTIRSNRSESIDQMNFTMCCWDTLEKGGYRCLPITVIEGE